MRRYYERIVLKTGEASSDINYAITSLPFSTNAILNLFRHHGWINIADAFRHYAASVQESLDLIGATTT